MRAAQQKGARLEHKGEKGEEEGKGDEEPGHDDIFPARREGGENKNHASCQFQPSADSAAAAPVIRAPYVTSALLIASSIVPSTGGEDAHAFTYSAF